MREILRFFVRTGHSITADCRNHKGNGCTDQEAPEADIQTCGVDHGRDTEDAVTAPGVELDAQPKENEANTVSIKMVGSVFVLFCPLPKIRK